MHLLMNRPRRLPGFRFDVQTPPPADVLPRMDIAVFVGFASAGPLHTPVAVEALAQFQEIFGDDLPLAWDPLGGQQLFAHLSPAVRDFFRNGGRRCWIIRVAGIQPSGDSHQGPETNYFALSGLLECADGNLRPAFGRARSPGAWFDSFRVSTALSSQTLDAVPIRTGSWTSDVAWLSVVLSSASDLVAGDLLRLNFPGAGLVAMMVVRLIEPLPSNATFVANRFFVTAGSVTWFQAPDSVTPPFAGSATLFAHDTERSGIGASIVSWPAGLASPLPSAPELPDDSAESVSIILDVAQADAPPAGTLVRANFAGRELWILVEEVSARLINSSPPGDGIQISGEAWWHLSSPPPVPESPAGAARLNFDLWVRRSNEIVNRIEGLGLAEPHPRFWNALPVDIDLYRSSDLQESLRFAGAQPYEALWRSSMTPRLPLAGDRARNSSVFLPLCMRPLPEFSLAPVHSERSALERDGLDLFAAELFLDPEMIEPTVTSLSAQADFVRYQSPDPRPLLGIHAAFSIEEATIIAVPDAVHLGWKGAITHKPADPQPSEPIERPYWWHFKECRPQREIPRTREPDWANFIPCDIHILPQPTLTLPASPDAYGSFTLRWSTLPSSEKKAQFVLEEARQADFDDAVPIYSGAATLINLYGRSTGDYYYRVRALAGCESSDWSPGLVVSVRPSEGWSANSSAKEIIPEPWMAVDRALLRMCAARGDLLAVLALPETYREADAIDYISRLKSSSAPALPVHGRPLLPLGAGDANALSYGACYHPWLVESEPGLDLRRVPPDGATCGILASRALRRGAWIAPANELLAGVVALVPPIDCSSRLDLQEARVNLYRQEPAGFLLLDADTLSDNEDLRPVNVRRLLILLRRLALREGPAYAFEPNDDSLRRLVQQRFEEFMNLLYARGAFAGATASEAFEVNTGDDVNTSQTVDRGQLIVELKVAPSLPLTFLTIRLVQIGDSATVLELS
jgi:hypothetical protein